MQIFKKLGWFFKQEKKAYFWGVLSLIIVALLQILTPRIIGLVVNEVNAKTLTKEKLWLYVGIVFVGGICQYILRFIWRTNIWGSAARLEKTLRKRLFHHFTSMDQVFFQKYRTGDLMAHATNDLNAIQNVAGAGVLTLVDSLLNGGITIIAMCLFIDWRLTLIVLIPLPLLGVMSRVLGSKMHDAFKESQEAFSIINDKTQESITGVKVIKTFGQESEDIQEFSEKIDHAITKQNRVNFIDSLFDPLITIIIGLSYVLTLSVGGYFVSKGIIKVGDMVSMFAYISMLVWPMFAIGRLFNVLERGSASYDRIQELLQETSQIAEQTHAINTPAAGDLAFDLTSFTYEGDEKQSLHNVHFLLKEGQTLGLVGKTGAGKTTILKLLLREFDHFDGVINWGNHRLEDYSLDALLSSIGYVPQDNFLFSMTVRDNIRFAKPEATQEEVEEVARLTAIHEDILGFPDGYDTMVGERGVSLSGGQKQRISIARALLLNPELLILDDSLSAVDAKTEESILSNLKTTRQNKTTIIAAHRLSSVMHAQEILVIDEGTISERGNHEQLEALNGWYEDMYERQQLEAKIEGGVA
ncbi:ABC transporter ATP-binding protein [Vagococcus xieshaowenii]|uniref:ATP-binding cassette domain-containing protein n=1 Tax=Vagococcus xieshaowenii TaxID=2562451 RepID=A0AAJ5JKW3_9ENTE|nr:ABC transporter transmembrane domain-containing protein [Vagococcus xieshaowenii]QCA28642.1 ATP-binding cassette domain-containing protein [Vagococcus xieshaowenii]TFZ40550.1 ATP-binding cassette domain-containing protein [Vagococcus xieshaowenii]